MGALQHNLQWQIDLKIERCPLGLLRHTPVPFYCGLGKKCVQVSKLSFCICFFHSVSSIWTLDVAAGARMGVDKA